VLKDILSNIKFRQALGDGAHERAPAGVSRGSSRHRRAASGDTSR